LGLPAREKFQRVLKAVNMELNRKKFTRRHDLSPVLRFMIAYTAWMSHQWGTVTQLAKQYLISRTFVYLLQHDLENAIPVIFGEQIGYEKTVTKTETHEFILSLRLEGKCGIEAISTIMKRFGYPDSSVGYISQILNHFGSLLDNTLKTSEDAVQLVMFASDEIFSKTQPILITIEPVSSAILRVELADSRDAETWKHHWLRLYDNGYYALYLVSDEGTGIKSAKKAVLEDVIHQPDTFHAISHQLGAWVNRLEQAAYKAIQEVYECYDKLDSAVSDRVINKRIDEYTSAEKKTAGAIALYDEFHDYYRFLIRQLTVFDDHGNLRDRTEAESNIKLALDLIITLGNNKMNKTIKKITNVLPDLLAYFNRAATIVKELQQIGISEDLLKQFCICWQYQKNMIKAKRKQRKNYYKDKLTRQISKIKQTLGDDYRSVADIVLTKLDGIVQSSALVETINSIVRSYLNTTRNHISQNLLNLIMFYHNHRRYMAGKRKNKSPLEILTGHEQQNDWMQLLFNEMELKVSNFSYV
jgi:hypothetical protein